MMKYPVLVTLLLGSVSAKPHVLLLPPESALAVLDEPQCGVIKDAYAVLFSQCSPPAVDVDLSPLVDSFEPVEKHLNITEEDLNATSTRMLRGEGGQDHRELGKRRLKCSDCHHNPEVNSYRWAFVCNIIDTYFSVAVVFLKF